MVVVAGIDDSPLAVPVIERAIEAARYRDAALEVVHVFHRPAIVDGGFGGIYPIDMSKLASAEYEHVWSRVKDTIEASPLPITTRDLEGYPPDALVAHVKEVGAALLVIGTRGRGEFA